QGMSLLALAYLLLERPMQRRFESDRLFQAVMLLLQERIPKATALFPNAAQLSDVRSTSFAAEIPIRVFSSPDTPLPEVQLLSNGRYHVMVTNAGGGYSRWKDLAVTRWREDGTCDNWGTFCYVREVGRGANGELWSTAHQPTLKRPESYEAIFSEGRAEFRRRDSVGSGDGDFETHTEIVVSPEDDIEVRRVRITNRSRQRREIDVTSYAEVVIAPQAADELHPAFSKLFVQTEILRERHAILCTRRPRSLGEQAPWMLHLMAVHGADSGEVSYETDRLRFIGRTRSTAAPLAMDDPAALSGGAGSVLDPIVAIRCRNTLDPEQSVTINIVSGITETRDMALSLVDKYQDRHLSDRVFDLAWTHSQVVLRQINTTEADAQLYARLASSVIHANISLRADPAVLIKNRRGQSGLWGYAISGDLPIVLLQIGAAANIDLVRQLVQAHAYWRLKGLAVDLVIWNEDHAGYRQQLQEQIMGLIASGIEASVIDRPGGIFVRPAEQISGEDRILFHAVARVVITDSRGTLAEQFDQRELAEARVPRLAPSRSHRPETPPAAPPRQDLILFNGLGGFTADGHEYVMTLAPGQVTPAPWVNVLANPHFGTIVSESGAAYTWSENAHEFRLTPWHNDPVSDSSGEAMYLRDEETGHVWSPTPLPANSDMPCVIRHGFGYSVFETRSGGICSELWIYVAMDAAVKFSVLKVRNESGRPRRLSATGYVEWVLGDLRAKSAMHVSTEIAPQSGALYARNPYHPDFAERVAFFDVDDPTRSLSGDRTEFLGRNGTLRNPAAMQRSRLSGKVGAGLDPCAAI
ncbi:MAG: cyclic beta 1-2 glucan synthetase, partial [Rhodocyclaceae bacterium]|nr:cyclic beta 1-2 glucan synthetase [Rhodocyclaceae bacterium]